jgi:hypothetical protein
MEAVLSPCSCQALQRFLGTLNDRVLRLESSITTINEAVDVRATKAELHTFLVSCQQRLEALEVSSRALHQAITLPDDLVR